jgi:peptidoglycan-associated lipoprotein
MKTRMNALLAVLSITALIAGGCASKEVVKTEEPGVATVQAEKPPVKPPPTTDDGASAARQQPVDAPVEIKPADAQPPKSAAEVSLFETVYFDFDKSDLRQDARVTLSRNAEIMLKTRTLKKVRIEGHCDERGSAEYNMALGERRAIAVQQYLVTLGVQPDRLSVISYGKEKPAVMGSGEEAWAKNRRAEFVAEK